MIEERSGHGDDHMEAIHWEFDVDRDGPEIPIAEVVAELEGANPTDLSPLYDRIGGLIATLFADPPPPNAQARIEFTYEGYRILLHQDGHATFMRIA